MYKIEITVLTKEEHDQWEHLCGIVGDPLDDRCESCKDLEKCFSSHVLIITMDAGNTFGQIFKNTVHQARGYEAEAGKEMLATMEELGRAVIAAKKEGRDRIMLGLNIQGEEIIQ